MECQLPCTVALDVDTAGECRGLGLFVCPSGGNPVSQQGSSVCKLQAANVVELYLSPSSTLGIFRQYGINGDASCNDARLREDQQGLLDEVVFVENGIIGPKSSLDVDQLFFEFHFATPLM